MVTCQYLTTTTNQGFRWISGILWVPQVVEFVFVPVEVSLSGNLKYMFYIMYVLNKTFVSLYLP